MKLPNVIEDGCPSVEDPSGAQSVCRDPRCDDPAFAAANPSICSPLAGARLILKPDAASMCSPGNLQFGAFIQVAGTEIELTSGLAYSSSDPTVLSIDQTTGAALLMGDGLVTVSVSWLFLNAFSQVTVTAGEACCEALEVDTAIVIDDSASMNLAFSDAYATRFLAARKIASDLAGALVESKDKMAVISFNTPATLRLDLTGVAADVRDAVLGVPTSTGKTGIRPALELAMLVLGFGAGGAIPPISPGGPGTGSGTDSTGSAQQLFIWPGDPNGHVTASCTPTRPAMCIDTVNKITWQKTDGITSNTGWY